ncbi:hypothetical protein [Halobellus salinisoli]
MCTKSISRSRSRRTGRGHRVAASRIEGVREEPERAGVTYL